jgi:rubredoxin
MTLTAQLRSRWKCPQCGSHRVHIRLPAWFTETAAGDLNQISIDFEADPQGWYCERCYGCEEGPPLFTADGELAPANDQDTQIDASSGCAGQAFGAVESQS